MKKSSKTSIRLNKKVRELFKVEFSRIAKDYDVNINDYWVSLERWLEVRKNWPSYPYFKNVRDFVYLINQSLDYYSSEETINLFLTEDLQSIDGYFFFITLINYFQEPLYSLEDTLKDTSTSSPTLLYLVRFSHFSAPNT